METNQKIDKIFSIVSDMKIDIAVIKNNDIHTSNRLTSIDKKIFVMDADIQGLNSKKAEVNIIGKGIMLVVGILCSITGSLVTIVINYYIRK